MANNPYAAPRTRVEDQSEAVNFSFDPNGRAVAFGNGWRWISDAWGLFMRQPGMWIGIVVTAVIALVLIQLVPLLGFLASSLLWPVVLGGFALGCRELDSGRELHFGHLFAGFSNRAGTLIGIGAFILAMNALILVAAAMLAGLNVSGMLNSTVMGKPDPNFANAGLALLLWILIAMAAWIPLYMALWFAPALVVLNGLGFGAALGASFRGCLRNILPFLLYGLVLFAFSILASIPIFLGWLALGPVMLASVYTGYRDIFAAH